MSSSNLSKFSILFTRTKSSDLCKIQIVPVGGGNDSYNVTFTLIESATEGAPTNENTEVWTCPKASIRQYVRNCITVVTKDTSAQSFMHMELQIPMFPTCMVDVRGSTVDQLLSIAFEHLDVISADDAKNWPTRPMNEATTASHSTNEAPSVSPT